MGQTHVGVGVVYLHVQLCFGPSIPSALPTNPQTPPRTPNTPNKTHQVEISYYLLRRLLGVKTQDGGKQAKVQKLQAKEILMVNIGSTATGGKVLALREDAGRREDYAKILLTQPVCTQEGEKIALSRRVDKHWRLIGWGQIRRGTTIEISASLPGGGSG